MQEISRQTSGVAKLVPILSTTLQIIFQTQFQTWKSLLENVDTILEGCNNGILHSKFFCFWTSSTVLHLKRLWELEPLSISC